MNRVKMKNNMYFVREDAVTTEVEQIQKQPAPITGESVVNEGFCEQFFG